MTFISPLNPGEKLPQLPQRNAPTIETHICIEQKSTLLEWAVRAILKSKKKTREDATLPIPISPTFFTGGHCIWPVESSGGRNHMC